MDFIWYVAIGSALSLLVIIALVLRFRRKDSSTDSDVAAPAAEADPSASMATEPPPADDTELPVVGVAETPAGETLAPAPAATVSLETESKVDIEPANPEIDWAPEFLDARAKLGESLKRGHFSKLDVFEDYRRESEQARSGMAPRSEYFHRVVNQALELRDQFEVLLLDEDRERFIEDHSRYLDEVTVEPDAATRSGLHQSQVELIYALRPKEIPSKSAA